MPETFPPPRRPSPAMANVRCRLPLMVRSRALVQWHGELIEVEIMVAPSQRFNRIVRLTGGCPWWKVAFGPFVLGVRCQGE